MISSWTSNETKQGSGSPRTTLAKNCVHFHEREIDGLNSFVGIFFDETSTHPLIYLPHGFPNVEHLSEAKLRDAIFTLVRVLTKDQRLISQAENQQRIDGVINDFPFESYRYIIQDFHNFGYVEESKRFESLYGSGRNDWRKTINKRQPLWTDQGAVHLLPIKAKAIKNYDFLMEVQKYCLNLSLLKVGWLYGKKPEIDFEKWSIAQMVRARNFIQKKKSSTFNERLSALLNHLQIVLDAQPKALQNSGHKNLVGAANSMHVVWERMVESVFGTGEHRNYLPTAIWKRVSGEEVSKQPLELDSIRWDHVEHGQTICTVIDAKYYRPGELPNTSDVNKQITYAEWVCQQDEVIDPRDVQNIFILPVHLENGVAKYEGYATMGIIEDTTKPYHRVHAIRVDTLTLMQWYLCKDRSRAAEIVGIRAGFV